MDYYLQNYFIYKNIPYLCTKEKIFQKYAHKMIKDFNFFAPTRIVFGKNAEMQIGDLVAQQNGHKVLVHYGGGSAERSGLLDVVREQLKSHGIPLWNWAVWFPIRCFRRFRKALVCVVVNRWTLFWPLVADQSLTLPKPLVMAACMMAMYGISGPGKLFLRPVCLLAWC